MQLAVLCVHRQDLNSSQSCIVIHAGESGSVQPVRLVQATPLVASQEAVIPVYGEQVEGGLGPTNAVYSQTGSGYGEERIAIDDILGKQGSLVRESSAIKAYSGILLSWIS